MDQIYKVHDTMIDNVYLVLIYLILYIFMQITIQQIGKGLTFEQGVLLNFTLFSISNIILFIYSYTVP